MSRTKITAAICAVGVIISLVMQSGKVRTNRAGLELIGNAEEYRRDPYVCPAGVLTDGIGNTHGVKPGTHKTDAQIAADWEKNIIAAEKCVNNYADGARLSDNTFSAVASITFNIGCGAMQKSTLFLMLRQGKTAQAFNVNRYNAVAATAAHANQLAAAGAEKTVIEYREILRREKTCDYPVPAAVARGLLSTAARLRASAMHADPGITDTADAGATACAMD